MRLSNHTHNRCYTENTHFSSSLKFKSLILQTDRITKEKKEGVLLALRVEKMVKKEKKRKRERKRNFIRKLTLDA